MHEPGDGQLTASSADPGLGLDPPVTASAGSGAVIAGCSGDALPGQTNATTSPALFV